GAQVFPQRLDPDGLRRVVPAIEDVDTQLFGIEERMVRPFTRDVGVEPRRSRLADHRTRASGDDPHTAHPLRAERHDARHGAERTVASHRSTAAATRLTSPVFATCSPLRAWGASGTSPTRR